MKYAKRTLHLSFVFIFFILVLSNPLHYLLVGNNNEANGLETYATQVVRSSSTGWINGTVSSLRGGNISDGQIRVIDPNSTSFTPIANVSIDSDNPNFSIKLPAPARYQIFAWAITFRQSKVFTVNLPAGKGVEINFTIAKYEILSGNVSSNGMPVSKAIVSIEKLDENNSKIKTLQLTTSKNGGFNTMLSSGRYNVTVTKVGYEPESKIVTIDRGERKNIVFDLDKIKEEESSGGYDILIISTIFALVVLFAVILTVMYTNHKRKKKKEEEEEEERVEEMECPFCGEVVPPDASECPNCGKVFMKRCPECGKQVKMQERECGECGFEFGG